MDPAAELHPCRVNSPGLRRIDDGQLISRDNGTLRIPYVNLSLRIRSADKVLTALGRREICSMCPTPQMVKLPSDLIGGGFILYGTYSIVTGTHHDSDDGPVEAHTHPVHFWLHVASVYLLGLLIIAGGVSDKGCHHFAGQANYEVKM